MDKKQKSPISVLFGLASDSKGKFIQSVVYAVIGVLAGVVPFFIGAKIIVSMINGEKDVNYYLILCGIALLAYILKVVFANVSTTISHSATWKTLRNIRLKMISKLSRMPMGTLLEVPSGQMTDTIVDRVEGLETTLAHLVPEMTANLLVPICLLVYLFVLDWRMALLTIAVLPVGMCFMGFMSKSYPAKYKESVRINKHMTDTVVEYVNGIEVIKAFNQSSNSYKKYEDAVVDNASFYYNWMKSCQLPMAAYTAICPSTLITVLPIGCIFFISSIVKMLRSAPSGKASARPAPQKNAPRPAAQTRPQVRAKARAHRDTEAEEAIHCAHLTGRAKYLEQIDNYLKTGLIDKDEYRVLKNRYMNLDIPDEYH